MTKSQRAKAAKAAAFKERALAQGLVAGAQKTKKKRVVYSKKKPQQQKSAAQELATPVAVDAQKTGSDQEDPKTNQGIDPEANDDDAVQKQVEKEEETQTPPVPGE